MTHNFFNTPENNQEFSESESTHILKATVDESGQAFIDEEQPNVDDEWARYFTETVRYIRQSLIKEDILKTATEEVRRVLDCDRVVVYSLNKQSQGLISAESVSPRFTKGLGRIIKDPCFEARYMEKYQDGRVKAIANIYEANLAACYIEQLEKLEVKANLVAPIINEGKLIGLLVAHQCSQPRYWLSHEITWFSQIAMQVGFALDSANILIEVANLKKQADGEAQWTQYFTDTVKLIRQSLNREDILEVATEEVRRILECDRVVIYGLNQDSYGVIIAESVAPRFTKGLGMILQDPCFEEKYFDKYQNGRVRVIPNIYQANLTPCHITQLERLEIKANLVAPIINEGKLLGLLVANQCSQFRDWHSYEVRWFSQIAMQVGFALENANVLAEADSLKDKVDTEAQWTQYFTDTVKLIRQSLNREDILEVATEEVRRILECDRVVIYGLNQDSYGVIIAESVAPRFTKGLGMILQDPCFEEKYFDKYQNGRVRVIPNIYQANLTPCHITQLEKLEIKANLVAPIINEGKLLGLLVANQCSQFRDWHSYEVRWFSQIAMQVGFALENAKLIESNAKANELNKSLFLPQQEDLRKVIIELSQDSKMIFKVFWNKALNISNYVAACGKEIHEILDAAQLIKITGEEVEKQIQRNYDLLESERENIKLTLENIPLLQEAAKDGEMRVKQLDEHCQNLCNYISQLDVRIAKQVSNSENNSEKAQITKEEFSGATAETQPLLTSDIAKINEIVEIIEVRNQEISTWVQSLQNNKQKLDTIVTANIQTSRLISTITKTANSQKEASAQLEKYIESLNQINQQILDKSQFFTNLFAQLTAFAQNSTQKVMFWERLKSFMISFHKLIASVIQKN
ncbi:GAF domain-containing protein [Rivularia sp. PCC 7116]|uniref:GAF domain-containing protein n=1 Tax=Rivularia sp. PCC 7116 TaxID=373994 RepID=UPI00029EF50E|nr:GAF domain-containing protein [Rivularia sp. PCC 7116]AFY54763.1 GAF domain-containing protein [Rivularia sp. PCC 7116]